MPGKKLLIVDDDRDLLQGLTVILKASGYEIFTAVDGIQAIIALRRHEPDLVLLDIGLPGGDGFMVLQRIKSMNPFANTPVLVLSALDPSTHREQAISAGAVDFLQKPAETPKLLEALRKALGESLDPTSPVAPLPSAKESRGITILVVDDDEDVLRSLSVRLRANGYNVITASDAISAVTKARKDTPDLIVLDIGLPGGDGYRVMERLGNLQSSARIPIIVISGREPSINRERALRAGARAYLPKPVDHLQLLAEIRRALAEHHGIQGWGGDHIGQKK